MPIQTKAQQDLILAERLVSAAPADKKVRDIYGGLCHNFPILVRTCGLCQALAFSADKATVPPAGSKARDQAHRLLLNHVAEIMGRPGEDPLALVRGTDAAGYMFQTRRILSAWIYFKRFAVSILKVTDARASETAAKEESHG